MAIVSRPSSVPVKVAVPPAPLPFCERSFTVTVVSARAEPQGASNSTDVAASVEMKRIFAIETIAFDSVTVHAYEACSAPARSIYSRNREDAGNPSGAIHANNV